MAMVGDSITEGSTDAIRYTLAAEGFVDMDIDGLTSRRIEEGDGSGSPLSGIATLTACWATRDRPRRVGRGAGHQRHRPVRRPRGVPSTFIRTVLEMIPDGIPLVWVDGFRADRPEASAEFDEILVDEVGAP